MTPPAGTPPVTTWSVGELHEALNEVLGAVFGEVVWVEGEVRNLKRPANGHRYFDLVDPDTDGPEAQRPVLSVTLFNAHRERVNQFLRDTGGAVRMDDGVRLRIGGRLRTYPVRSSVQLLMDRIDPTFTLGVLGQERARLLAALVEEGLLGANAAVPLPLVPLAVALVTSAGSAAQADALAELAGSGLGFRVSAIDVRTQGVDAEAQVCAALRAAEALRVDAVLLVRGGGAATDLAAFDSERIARTIAALGVPVLTGIGHETDRSVADEVAHQAHKTPTAAAAALVERVRAGAAAVEAAQAALATAAAGRLVRAGAELDRVARRCGSAAAHRLGTERQRVDLAAHRVVAAAPRRLDAATDAVDGAVAVLAGRAGRTLEVADLRLDALAAAASAADPARLLARGWSITTDGDGRVVRDPATVAVGDELHTRLAGGTLHSTVTASTATLGTGDDPAPTSDPPTA